MNGQNISLHTGTNELERSCRTGMIRVGVVENKNYLEVDMHK